MKGRYTSFDRKEKQSFKQAATHLYASLLGPFEDLIGSRNLIIIPDGPLNLIPFEALIAPDPEKNSDTYLSFNYLIKNHMISYGLSATLWNYKSGSRNKPAKGILAVAPEYDPDIIAQSELLRAKADALPPLKGTVEESRSARRMISGRLLTGSKARESTFKKICNDFSVIHLAMHTVTDPNDPLNTFLVFTPGADHEDDGLLYSREIYNLDLGASLVVLSACETGSGEMAAGEGIISLGRGFLFAGCSNMIITLWTVDDVSGKTIMKMFYRNLRSGQSISNALRNSKLTYIDQADEIHAHPYFWAAFSAVGPDNMVELRHGNMMIWYILLAVMIVLAATYSFVQKRKSPPSGGDISETD
jgi:CHAT domain-containing protein